MQPFPWTAYFFVAIPNPKQNLFILSITHSSSFIMFGRQPRFGTPFPPHQFSIVDESASSPTHDHRSWSSFMFMVHVHVVAYIWTQFTLLAPPVRGAQRHRTKIRRHSPSSIIVQIPPSSSLLQRNIALHHRMYDFLSTNINPITITITIRVLLLRYGGFGCSGCSGLFWFDDSIGLPMT